MALAIRFEAMLRDGEVRDQLELARLAPRHVTSDDRNSEPFAFGPFDPGRDFTLARVTEDKDPVHERMLRPIAAEVDWERQREMWEETAVVNLA